MRPGLGWPRGQTGYSAYIPTRPLVGNPDGTSALAPAAGQVVPPLRHPVGGRVSHHLRMPLRPPENPLLLPSGLRAPAAKPTGEAVIADHPDDEAKIRRAFDADPYAGCDLLFRRYYQPLCNHAVRYVYSKMVAEDIVADIFQVFWRKRTFERIRVSYRSYLYQAVRRNCLLHLQREAGRTVSQQVLTRTEWSALTTPSEELMRFEELSRQIDAIVDTLSPAVRRVFLLSRFEGRRNQEIADELHLSRKTVEAHLTKALALFRKVLLR